MCVGKRNQGKIEVKVREVINLSAWYGRYESYQPDLHDNRGTRVCVVVQKSNMDLRLVAEYLDLNVCCEFWCRL